MKTSVLASMLFSSLALAAPLEKRAYVTKTNTIVETVVVYTTVWAGEGAAAPAKATTAPGLFYENQPKQSSAAPSSTPAYTPPVVNTPSAQQKPSSSAYTPPPAASTPAAEKPKPTSIYTPPAQPSSVVVAPSSAAAAPPAASSAAAQPSQGTGGGSSEVHSGGSITMNYFSGGKGACNDPIADTDMAVALASDLMGPSTYDKMTGNPTNKWCGAKVEITYNGKSHNAVIMDRCEGCTNGGFDMTPALWKEVTGGAGGGSGDRLYGATWKVTSWKN